MTHRQALMLASAPNPRRFSRTLALPDPRQAGRGEQPERVDWIESHNSRRRPELAAKINGGDRQLSSKVEKPVYHASINWHPGEAPTPAEMKEIARRSSNSWARRAPSARGFGHGDTAHRHRT